MTHPPTSRLRDIWLELCRSLGIASERHLAWWEDLVERHAEPQRHYHTLSHVEAILTTLQRHESSLRSPALVYVAGFFHDAVYNPRAGDNEQRSADLAANFLNEAGIEESFVSSVRNLILATAGHMDGLPTGDACWFLDADLTILGADPAAYDEYASAIRREYDFVPETEYRTGRSSVLREFLAAPEIYRTAAIKEQLEDQARSNLARELASLASAD
jgi:predicted metal-dependent HD superfamily phosphohydrolase